MDPSAADNGILPEYVTTASLNVPPLVAVPAELYAVVGRLTLVTVAYEVKMFVVLTILDANAPTKMFLTNSEAASVFS